MARRGNFFSVCNAVFDQYGHELGPCGWAVYVALARRANREGVSWASIQTMAGDVGINERTFRRHLKRLECLGLVSVFRQKMSNGYRRNFYRLLGVDSGQKVQKFRSESTKVSVRESDKQETRTTHKNKGGAQVENNNVEKCPKCGGVGYVENGAFGWVQCSCNGGE